MASVPLVQSCSWVTVVLVGCVPPLGHWAVVAALLPEVVLTVWVTVEPLGVEPQAFTTGAAQVPVKPVSLGVPVPWVLVRPSVQR